LGALLGPFEEACIAKANLGTPKKAGAMKKKGSGI